MHKAVIFGVLIVLCCLDINTIFQEVHAEGITVTVLDIMNLSKDEFIANGLGSGTAYTSQRQAITEGSSFLLTTASSSITKQQPTASSSNMPTWMASSSSQSIWRRAGQYMGGGSEAEEEEFFAEADRVYERWLEAQQLRKIQEAREKKNNPKNDGQRASAEASSEENESSPKKGKNQKDKANGKGQNKDDDKGTNNLPLALPAATLSTQDAKRRKIILNPNTTIEQKIKNVAYDVKSVMKRLRAAFLPSVSAQYKIAPSGKSAANAARHRRFLFERYYNGMLPESLIMDPATGRPTENMTLIEEAVGNVIYDMLRSYTSTSTSSSDDTASQPSFITGLVTPIISTVNPYAWYPRLHSLPIIDVDELSLLSEELRYLKAAEMAIEHQFAPIEKGAYPHDLSLKIASLMKADKNPSDHHHYGEGKSTLAMIENNPREYYRSLRQYTLDPKIGAELNVLSNVINTNYQYQSQLIHSSYPILAMMLPRLRAEVAALKSNMRANDESTAAQRKQLKEQNQILKIMNNDIAILNGISMRMNRFRLNGHIGAASSVTSRALLLSAADVTTLLMWITEERRSGAASSASIHKEDFTRIQLGEQPLESLMDADESDTDDSSSSSSSKKRKSRRSKRRGETSDNYLEGDANDFVRRPISEWAHVVTFSAFGLSLFEMLNLVLAIGLIPLIDGLVQTPLLLVRYTRWLIFFAYPSLRRWAGGNRLSGPSSLGKAFLVVCQIHLYCMTLITDFFVRFGAIAMPLIGLYYTEVMEARVLAFLMYVRQFIASTYSTARGNVPAPHASFSEIQMTLRQRIPFSVWVLATPLQQVTLAVLLVVLGTVITMMFTTPMYRRAKRDLARLLGKKEK